jgi:diacylglycerol kinase (ATP)
MSPSATAAPFGGSVVTVVFNPRAGRRLPFVGAASSASDVGAVLEAAGIRAAIVETTSVRHARDLAARAVAGREPVVIAAGGDGTIAAVAAEVARSETALGILPMGSVMNIPRMLGIPRDLQAAARILAAGRVRQLDVVVAGDRPYFEAASIGIVAAVFRGLDLVEGRGRRRAWLEAIRAGLGYRRTRMRLLLDGRIVETRALLVTVANGPYAGAAMTVAPDAMPGDGLLDVRIFEEYTKGRLLWHFMAIAGGRRASERGVRAYRASTVAITTSRPIAVRADAQDLGTTPVEFRILPGVVRVVAPAGSGQV